MVFLGTVTEVLEMDGSFVRRARMRVDRAWKGVSEKELILYDDGMCDGPDLQLGGQYLMYTGRYATGGDVPSRGCSRSRHVDDAAEDLEFLNGLSAAKPLSRIFGGTFVRTDDWSGNDKPAPGVIITATGSGRRLTTSSDANGLYSFRDLEPGEYTIAAERPGYRFLQMPDAPPVQVKARGCANVNILLRRAWPGTIEGRVQRADGSAAPAGMVVDLLTILRDEGEESAVWIRSAETDDDGSYEFYEVAPRQYKLALNRDRFPTAKNAAPAIFWPDARTEAGATTIEVADAPVSGRFDFKLPPEPRRAKVTGIVLRADGKPLEQASVSISVLPNKSISDDEEASSPRVDASGRFTWTAFSGFEYELSAATDGDRPMHSAEVRFTLDGTTESVVLVIDRPGRYENDPVLRQNAAAPPE